LDEVTNDTEPFKLKQSPAAIKRGDWGRYSCHFNLSGDILGMWNEKAPAVIDWKVRVCTLPTQPSVEAKRNPSVKLPATKGWVFSPWVDAFLIANIAWPLYGLLETTDGFGGGSGLRFWQVYYVTTPHRWITLAIVFLDRERFRERRGMFLGLAAAATALCVGIRLSTGALSCLLTIDFIWNAWHFASQHHGIYRIYGRLNSSAPGSNLALEKYAMRGFILYVILRVGILTWANEALDQKLELCDWIVLLVPLWLLVRDVVQTGAWWTSRTLYLASVNALYITMLWAVHERRPTLLMGLATAGALFHATEYLAIVTWSVQQRGAARPGRLGLLGYLVARWAIALGAFVLILGAGGWLMERKIPEEWLFLTVVVSFLHYAYDGLIWRRGRKS
jgi:hypothetical protein